MNPNNNLETRIAALEKWKADRERQQITLPLDSMSLDILGNNFMHIIGELRYEGGIGSNVFVTYIGQQGEMIFSVYPPIDIFYSVNITNDTLTTSGTNLKIWDDEEITLFTTGSAPSPLIAGLGYPYFPKNSDGFTFQIARAPNGNFTVTIASPAVFSKTNHYLQLNDKIRLTTTGALPTGLSVATDYYVIAAGLTSDAFQVSTSLGGGAVNTSGSQSGTHTLIAQPYDITDVGSGRQFLNFG